MADEAATTKAATPLAVGLADSLAAAWRDGRAISAQPWATALDGASAAYAVQDLLGRSMGWFGPELARHWKSGGPNRQAVLTHAPLPPAGVRASPARCADMQFQTLGIEAEIALRLGEAVTPAQAAILNASDAAALVDAMAVSIEIVDSRWQEGGDAPALLRLADLQSHGALVLGEWKPYAARDWAAQSCEVRIGSQAPVVRQGTHPLGDPGWLLPVWLRHLARSGLTVPAGTVVTTGSWVGMLQAQPGDSVAVSFEGVGSAAVQL
ncbi:fumarylacetoacetate hydrolase family protein [Acidovorax sp. sic0104]|uniref:fumarylacetoacetate hydrolase family protein n=1 Tax=Acidovorax sp. sic0104 TaxID=2854784 RepID=UPI001C483BFA|nr:fumarylacetoacetate hydrolase family protein [Acidovorax sp. sic0104]MBV7542742.1 fumarylacetoacetate hydrolase family protein [Acidovorax sp. sic0104]